MKAHELLDSPDKFTKGVYARNTDGAPCDVHNPKAVCWCIVGALRKCYHDNSNFIKTYRSVQKFIDKKITGHRSIQVFNDESSYKDVIEVLKELDV